MVVPHAPVRSEAGLRRGHLPDRPPRVPVHCQGSGCKEPLPAQVSAWPTVCLAINPYASRSRSLMAALSGACEGGHRVPADLYQEYATAWLSAHSWCLLDHDSRVFLICLQLRAGAPWSRHRQPGWRHVQHLHHHWLLLPVCCHGPVRCQDPAGCLHSGGHDVCLPGWHACPAQGWGTAPPHTRVLALTCLLLLRSRVTECGRLDAA